LLLLLKIKETLSARVLPIVPFTLRECLQNVLRMSELLCARAAGNNVLLNLCVKSKVFKLFDTRGTIFKATRDNIVLLFETAASSTLVRSAQRGWSATRGSASLCALPRVALHPRWALLLVMGVGVREIVSVLLCAIFRAICIRGPFFSPAVP